MKTKRFIFLPVILSCGLATYALGAAPDTVKSAPGITIETAVDKSEIYIGDLINYRLTIMHDSTIDLIPPPVGANLGAFDVKDYQVDEATKQKDGRIKIESRFMLTTFTTGDYIIPPIPVEFRLPDSTVKFLISEPTPIRVKSLLAEAADTSDIRDIKGPLEFRSERAIYYYLGAALLILLAVGGYIYWRIRRKRMLGGGPVDLRQPWEIAFEELALLKEEKYLAEGEFKLYYIELSEIVRAFFGRVYKIPVLDMTTEEFLGRVIERDTAEGTYDRLQRFLNYADLVKFAKLVPESDKPIADYNEAVALIEAARQKEVARQAAPAQAIAGSEHV